MKTIQKIVLGLENTGEIILPIEQVSMLKFNDIDAIGSYIYNMDEPDLKIIFSIKLENYGYYNGTAEDAQYYGEFLFANNRYNLVDITLVYCNGTEVKISLPWEDGRYDFENKFEVLTRLPDGQVQIEIRKA